MPINQTLPNPSGSTVDGILFKFRKVTRGLFTRAGLRLGDGEPPTTSLDVVETIDGGDVSAKVHNLSKTSNDSSSSIGLGVGPDTHIQGEMRARKKTPASTSNGLLEFFVRKVDVLIKAMAIDPDLGVVVDSLTTDVLRLVEDPSPEPSPVVGSSAIWTRSDGVLMSTDVTGTHELHSDALAGIGVSRVISGPLSLATPVLQEWTPVLGFDHTVIEDGYGRITADFTNGCLIVDTHPQAAGFYEANWQGSMQVSGGSDKDVVLDVMLVPATPIALESASNTPPIVVGLTAHGYEEETALIIEGETGNTAINGSWVVTNPTPDTFQLRSLGNSIANGSGVFVGDGGIVGIGRAGTTIRKTVKDGEPEASSGRAIGPLGPGDAACLYYAVLDSPSRALEIYSLAFNLVRIASLP